jgi:hypothetical protein
MKNVFKLIITIVFIFSLVLPVSAAGGNVTYSGNAGEFIFEPGSEYSPTDLFTDFKDVMPGDTITQTITIKNNATKNVRISMRSLGAHEESVDFLKQLTLYVEKPENTPLFEAAADQKAQLTEWTELGIFAPGAVMDLEIGLQVPTSVDNTYKSLIGYIDWEFVVEETDDGPQTGDTATVLPWVIGATGSVLLIAIILLERRKDNTDETK